MAETPTPALAELLKHFDQETASMLARSVGEGKFTAAHIQELIRLTAVLPEYRDLESLESLLEDAEEMDAEAFRTWVDQLIKDSQQA